MTTTALQKVTAFNEAVRLVAGGDLTDEAIAEAVGRTRMWLWRQKNKPEFADAVRSIQEATRLEADDRLITAKAERIRRLDMLWSKCDEVLNDKGLVTIERRTFGETEVETEFFNEGLVRQMRGILDDVAKEVGDRQRKEGPLVQVNNFIALMEGL